MSQPISLTVHRNNQVQRQAKRTRTMLKDGAKAIAAIPHIAGYAMVAWDAERGYRADWYAPNKGPLSASVMPEYVKVCLLRSIVKSDTQQLLWPFDDDGAA